MTSETGLPPALDALKNTVRQIVRDECIPLEPEYLANPPRKGNPTMERRGACWKPCRACWALSRRGNGRG